jgi:hypothetical protein
MLANMISDMDQEQQVQPPRPPCPPAPRPRPAHVDAHARTHSMPRRVGGSILHSVSGGQRRKR